MEEYYFLFGLAALFSIFAIFVDFKKREVPNWLNFSLIGFALAYRAFYSIHSKDVSYFVFGVIGFAIFFTLAYGFYFARAFAGGDAKLLMGFGIILPYNEIPELIYFSILFISALFSLGAIYSLIYSLFIVSKRKDRFYLEFVKKIKKIHKIFFFLCIILIGALLSNNLLGWVSFLSILGLFLLYIYISILDKCMIIKLDASSLSEGDWLDKNVNVGNKIIKKSVHGLSLKDIKILKKANKKVYIKEGIPFTPAFLISLITVFFFLFLGFQDLSFLF